MRAQATDSALSTISCGWRGEVWQPVSPVHCPPQNVQPTPCVSKAKMVGASREKVDGSMAVVYGKIVSKLS